ncbi:MAG: MGH1-like glycoside hydrolase domain-containing protein [Sphingobacteriaceae bacterium]
MYRKFQDKWLLEYLYNELLRWNRWCSKNRDNDGLLCWGTSVVEPPLKSDFATNNWQGAAYESGLDNSSINDDVLFNKQTYILELADAGLMGLNVIDCDALADISMTLGKTEEAKELTGRVAYCRKNLAKLWDEKAGTYKNKRADTKVFSNRLSPTHFYPMLAKAPTQAQTVRMAKEPSA